MQPSTLGGEIKGATGKGDTRPRLRRLAPRQRGACRRMPPSSSSTWFFFPSALFASLSYTDLFATGQPRCRSLDGAPGCGGCEERSRGCGGGRCCCGRVRADGFQAAVAKLPPRLVDRRAERRKRRGQRRRLLSLWSPGVARHWGFKQRQRQERKRAKTPCSLFFVALFYFPFSRRKK